jgi:hypothetical protein
MRTNSLRRLVDKTMPGRGLRSVGPLVGVRACAAGSVGLRNRCSMTRPPALAMLHELLSKKLMYYVRLSHNLIFIVQIDCACAAETLRLHKMGKRKPRQVAI